MGPDEKTVESGRNIFIRIISSVGWFFPLLIITNMIMGALLGTAGSLRSPAASFTDGYETGRNSSREFLKKNRRFLLPLQIILWLGLCVTGKLPGTSSQKPMKEPPGAKKESAHIHHE